MAAELTGLSIGGVSLLGFFEAGMNAFDHIETARAYGEDYQRFVLKAAVLRLRLARWANGIDLLSRAESVGTPEEANIAKLLLGNVASDIEKTGVFAKGDTVNDNSLPAVEDERQLTTIDELAKRVDSMAIRRHRKSTLGQKARWALRDHAKFKKLLENLNEHITELERLFPGHASLQDAEKRLAQEDATELVRASGNDIDDGASGETAVEVLVKATCDIDEQLMGGIEQAISHDGRRHVYNTVVNAEDTARVQMGDYVAPGQTATGTGHRYEGIMNSQGNAKVHMGDSFGGPQIFDM
jgi:hypothetical protein